MQPKLLGGNFVGGLKPVANTSFPNQSGVEFVLLAADNMPGHLDVAVGRDVDGSWWRGLLERNTKRPSAENIPLGNTCPRLQPYELVPSL